MQPVDIRRFQEAGFERLRAKERTAGALPSHRRYQYSQAAPPPLPLPAQTTAPPPDPHGPPPVLRRFMIQPQIDPREVDYLSHHTDR